MMVAFAHHDENHGGEVGPDHNVVGSHTGHTEGAGHHAGHHTSESDSDTSESHHHGAGHIHGAGHVHGVHH